MMNKQRTSVSKKKVTANRSRVNQKLASGYYLRCKNHCKKIWQQLKTRRAHFLKRRPHRSFRLTRRRDYVRSLHVPGYWSLTTQSAKMIWLNKRLFFGLALVYALIVFVLAGLMDQETYKKIKALAEGTVEQGAVSDLFATFSIFGGVVYGQLTNQPNNALQQILGVLALIMVWLTTIWLLRSVSSGNLPNIRDGLYRAGAPLVAFIVLLFIVLCQILPAAGGVILYTTLKPDTTVDDRRSNHGAAGSAIAVLAHLHCFCHDYCYAARHLPNAGCTYGWRHCGRSSYPHFVTDVVAGYHANVALGGYSHPNHQTGRLCDGLD